jgi:hypothetical protein
MVAVVTWLLGFDILYSLQDEPSIATRGSTRSRRASARVGRSPSARRRTS